MCKYIKYIKLYYIMPNSNKTCIILTATVTIMPNVWYLLQTDKQQRLDIYLKSIRQWLQNTHFNIILVENSGYTFPELDEEKIQYKDRFEIISYDATTLSEAAYLLNYQHKGGHELFALNYAYNNSILIKSVIFIIKVTCRYFIPTFEEFINNIENVENVHILRQNNWLRCEVVGASTSYYTALFSLHNIMDHIELLYNQRIQWLNEHVITADQIITCPVFNIEPTMNGGGNQSCDNL